MPRLLLIAFIVLAVVWWAWRSRDIFCISVRRGRLLLVRGNLPQGLLNDFAEVVRDAGLQQATIRAVAQSDSARLIVQGPVGDGPAQRLRNVFGLCPVAKIRASRVRRQRNLGQLLGIVWLAWLLTGSSKRSGS